MESDHRALVQLQASSSAFRFEVLQLGESGVPDAYTLTFLGPSLERIDLLQRYEIRVRETHQVYLSMGPDYPRTLPTLKWLTPIFHPNISANGSICLGGYSSHWVPSLQIDQLCEMLWDVLCFRNFNLESPFHQDAARWMEQQSTFRFPLDPRPLRHESFGFPRAHEFRMAEASPQRTDEIPSPSRRTLHSGLDEMASSEIVFIERPTQ